MEELRDCISFVDSREEAVRISAPERLVTFSANFLDALALMSDEERVRCLSFQQPPCPREDYSWTGRLIARQLLLLLTAAVPLHAALLPAGLAAANRRVRHRLDDASREAGRTADRYLWAGGARQGG